MKSSLSLRALRAPALILAILATGFCFSGLGKDNFELSDLPPSEKNAIELSQDRTPAPSSPDETLLRFFNEQNFSEALKLLQDQTAKNPDFILQPESLFNFSLVSWHLGKLDLAAAYLLEAKRRYPLSPPIRSLERFFIQERPQVFSRLSTSPIPWVLNWSLLALSGLGLVWAIFILIRGLQRRKTISTHHTDSPSLRPQMGQFGLVFMTLFLLLSSLTGVQIHSQWTWSTLVTEAQASIKTRPDDLAPNLAQISQGQMVRVLELPSSSPWVLVELTSGLRGWTNVSNLKVLKNHPILFLNSPRQKFLALFNESPSPSPREEEPTRSQGEQIKIEVPIDNSNHDSSQIDRGEE